MKDRTKHEAFSSPAIALTHAEIDPGVPIRQAQAVNKQGCFAPCRENIPQVTSARRMAPVVQNVKLKVTETSFEKCTCKYGLDR